MSAEWVFEIQYEYRNDEFCQFLARTGAAALNADSDDYPKVYRAYLPAGTTLRVERIYIKKGAPIYNSMTFYIVDCPNKQLAPKKAGGTFKGRPRFWVTLAEANRMDIVPPGSVAAAP